MNNKAEISCPNCNHVVRIPTGKHIKFSCPNCANEIEVDGKPKVTIPKKGNYNWFITGILSALLFFGYKYYVKNKDVEQKIGLDILKEKGQSQPETKISNEQIQFDNNLQALIKAVDISNETTNDFAVRLASRFPGEYNIGQICQIYDYIVKNWKYVNDSDKMENFRSASRTINNDFSGDCDDFAILLAAMIESIGGDSRISFAYNEKEGHAFTEVLATNSKEEMQAIVDEINALYGTDQFEINYSEDSDGKCWLNLDWFGRPQHPGGQYFNYTQRVIYYPTLEKPIYILE